MGKWRSECSVCCNKGRRRGKEGKRKKGKQRRVKCRKGRERVLLFSLSIIFVTSSIV